MSPEAHEIDLKFSESITFSGFVFRTRSGQLQTADGKPVDLRTQAAEALSILAARPGEIVSKEALIQAVWPDTFVTEGSLTQCIADIRRALGDDGHVIVQTFPKRGYRLNVDRPDAVTDATIERGRRRFSLRNSVLAAIVLAAAAIGAYFGVGQWRGVPVRSSDIPRIAVLPFEDFSTGADEEYLSDAVAEGIITELARSKTYVVIARNSSFRYRGQPVDVMQIGEELGVDYVLAGSQQKIGGRLRVTAQLLDARDGSHLWANTYNREIGDFFFVQAEIIRTLSNRVGHSIMRPWPLSEASRVSALRYYLLGCAEIQKDFSPRANQVQRQLSLQAVEADPSSQFGFIGLAHTYQRDAAFGWNQQEHSREEALKRAAEYADKAILLAPDDAESHRARASVHTEAGEVELALARYDQAIALNPSNSEILVASAEPLVNLGRTDEAIDRIKQAMGIDPFYPEWFNWQMGWVLYHKNECEAALGWMRKMSRIQDSAHRTLASIYACLGDEREAKQALVVFLKDSPGDSISRVREQWGNSRIGPAAVERLVNHLRIAGLPE